MMNTNMPNIFSAAVAGTDEIRYWIMSWGKNAEALEPDFLREEIARELSASLKRYVPDPRRAEEITHRCHKREFLLKLAEDLYRWLNLNV
jgi:hypothetical protein